MKIVSLEDDEPFWDLLKEALEEEFAGAELLWVRTESQFYEQIPAFVAEAPSVFLLDIMVKWADPSENMPPAPQKVLEENYYRAGLRCRNRLLENPATEKIPVILFTVLERADIERVSTELPHGTTIVDKSSDFRQLISAINNVTAPPQSSAKRS